MRMRRLVSLTALWSFVVLVVTGVVLFITPQGRVAYWSDWRLWGWTKTDWTNMHLNVSLLFLLAGILHILYNWNAITTYLRDRLRRMVVFTRESTLGLILTLLFAGGGLMLIGPFGWLIDWNTAIKDTAAERYGEPPYGHAELSTFAQFAQKVGIDLEQGLERLRNAGLEVAGPEQTLKDAAGANDVPPQRLFELMRAPGDGRRSTDTP